MEKENLPVQKLSGREKTGQRKEEISLSRSLVGEKKPEIEKENLHVQKLRAATLLERKKKKKKEKEEEKEIRRREMRR